MKESALDQLSRESKIREQQAKRLAVIEQRKAGLPTKLPDGSVPDTLRGRIKYYANRLALGLPTNSRHGKHS